MSSDTANSQTSDRSYRQCLSVGVAAMVNEIGFDMAEPMALETLTEVLQSYLCELGRSIHAFTELACRQTPLPADILLALVEMGSDTQGLHDYAFRNSRKSLSNPATAQTTKPPTILHTGDRKRHRPGGIVPENFVEFPDSHSYIRTPTHKQPITDYENVREKAASQKRDVERALTRFIAKTGKTHSLFNTDDTNLFPLISCDRVMPEQPLLPSYINALLFKDQIFEEDEREFIAKKKKEDDEEEEPENEEDKNADDKSDNETKDEDNTEIKSEKPAKVENKEETDTIENPYLKPVRVPRSSAIKRLL